MRHPYTLFIAGHDHSYKHKTAVVRGEMRDLVDGTGGAPFDGTWTNPWNGYSIVDQRPDGRIQVTAYKVEPGMDVVGVRAADPAAVGQLRILDPVTDAKLCETSVRPEIARRASQL